MKKNNNEDIIKLRVRVSKKLFYNNGWGVYSFFPVTNKEMVETHPVYKTFVVNGNAPNLTEQKEYDIEITPSYNKKYGDGYSFMSVHVPRPETVEEQQEYVKTLLTDRQYQSIVKAYPDKPILDMIKNNELDVSRIKGIKETTLEKIRVKLFEDVDLNYILVELRELNLTANAAKRLLKYFENAQTVVDMARDNIYAFCRVKGFGFKTIDKFAMNRGDSPVSTKRIRAGIEYILEQDANNGDSWIPNSELTKKSIELLGIHEGYISDFLEIAVKVDKYIYTSENKVALRKNYEYELKFYEKITQLLNSPSKTTVKNLDEKIRNLEEKNGFQYTSEQREAIKKAVNNNVLVINGRAGTGKTTLLKGIVDVLKEYSYMSMSLSGKAVQVLMENGLRASTIHKALYSTGNFDEDGDEKEGVKINVDIIIIDESSMVNNSLFYMITKAMKDDSKIIFVGDSGQLPAIGTGAIFDDLIRFGDIPKQELTIVHRQAKKSGILSTANLIRDGKQINAYNSEKTEVYGELKDMVLIPTNDNTDIKDMILDIAKRNKDTDLFNFQVIAGRVDSGDLSVKNLNIELQKIFNDVGKPFVSRGGYDFRIGDKIIQSGNNYEAKVSSFYFDEEEDADTTEVFNGTLGKIVNIEFDKDKTRKNHKVLIKFEDNEHLIVYDINELSQIDLAYALTVHRCQGSAFNKLVFAFDSSAFMLLSKEFIYTGITRAREGCIMIANKKMLHMGINKTHGSNRRTFLKDFLRS